MTLRELLEDGMEHAMRRRRWRNDDDGQVCIETVNNCGPVYYVIRGKDSFDRGAWTPSRLDLLAEDWEECEFLSCRPKGVRHEVDC